MAELQRNIELALIASLKECGYEFEDEKKWSVLTKEVNRFSYPPSSHLFLIYSFSVGRPRIDVNIEEIELLRSMRFTWTKISELLGISRSTLYRKLEEEGMSQEVHYTSISDHDLDDQIIAIKLAHPNDGEVLLNGHLIRRKIFIPRSKLRASIHRVDPTNTALRKSITVRRRVYHAEGPNAVWHVDGHHKLIHWRLVTHGGVDGFSRTIVYLKCSDNNRASTVLGAYTEAVRNHGLPCKVRSDLGGENVAVWQYMVEQHMSESAVVTGSSTNNERVERLWRDVFRCIISLFYETFRSLEDEGKLDHLNEVDMYCLHFIFLPRINHALKEFVSSWNNHRISTEHNKTPNQLFVEGFMAQDNQGFVVPSPSNSTDNSQTSHPHAEEAPKVPRIKFEPCNILSQQLAAVNPFAPTTNYGIDLYLTLVNTVGRHLSNCNECS